MNSEMRTCQNCKNQFTIEPDDFAFYERISAKGGSASGGKVPPPTWCPECRMMRRFSWRNERTFYGNQCALTGKKVISGFAPASGIVVYDRDIWWSDQWEATEFGREYDFSKSFFQQFRELFLSAPMPAVFNGLTVNCDYTQHTGDMKNGYLVSVSWGGENISYASRIHESKDSMDVLMLANSELMYECISANKAYHTLFSQNIDNCTDSYFLFECKGCSNCFGCTNLRNKNYYIFNRPYTKEEYHRKLKDFDLGSYFKLLEIKRQFLELKQSAIHRHANIINSQSVSGDNITNTSNCQECFDISSDVRDSKFVQNAIGPMQDSYDGYGVGASAELLYEVFDTGAQGARICFGGINWSDVNAFYSYNCHGCQNIFACIGLRNKQYCILNKQYTKEEYEKLVPKIMQHMDETPYTDKKGRIYKYGEFFPSELSPFVYNETIAQEYFPLTKEQALAQGYSWRDPEPRAYEITSRVESLPDHIKDAKDTILKEIIGCAHEGKCNEQCTTAFKIILQELEFYRKMSLPLPRLCPNCRHYQRLKQRNPLKLWHRKCTCGGTKSGNGVYQNQTPHFHGKDHCPNEFETSYAHERPEIVYCESCYQSEVI